MRLRIGITPICDLHMESLYYVFEAFLAFSAPFSINYALAAGECFKGLLIF